MKLEFTKYFLLIPLLMIFAICLFDNVFAENIDEKQWQNYFLGKSVNNKPPKSDQLFKFQFRVTNGTINKLTQDYDTGSIIADVYSSSNSTLEIKFPRNYPFMQGYDNASVHYTPLVYFATKYVLNSTEYTVNSLDCFFVYSIPFSGNSKVSMVIAYPLISGLPNIYHGDNIPQSCNSQTIASYLPPLKQIRDGITPNNVSCMNGFVTVLHNTNNLPACVKPDTSKILVERGWAKAS
jgi:hypothetical protein